MISNWLSKDKIGSYWCLAMIVFSIAIYPLIIIYDYHVPPNGLSEYFYYKNIPHPGFDESFGYRTYFEKLNWCLYPLFFLIIAPLIYSTWVPYMDAWREDDVENPIVRNHNGTEISNDARNDLLAEFSGYRVRFVLIALIASTIFCYFDMAEMRKSIFGNTYATQLESSCENPDFFEKWIFIHESSRSSQIESCADIRPYAALTEKEVSALSREQAEAINTKRKKLLNERDETPTAPPWHQLMIIAICYFQQFNIIAMGFLSLLQMLSQPVILGFFDKLKTSKINKLIIIFDHRSPFEDFGLGPWNRALDTQFWFLFIALLIPLVSKIAQQPGQIDFGHHTGGILLLILVWLPAILALISRKRWKDESRKRADNEGNEAIEMFNKQHVWPFDKDITMKAGFLLSLVVLGMIVGADLTSIFSGK